jgi:hypothetical protein
MALLLYCSNSGFTTSALALLLDYLKSTAITTTTTALYSRGVNAGIGSG